VSAGSLAQYREANARRGRDTTHLAGLDTGITVFDLNIASVTLTVMFALIVIVTVRWGYQRVPLHGAARFAWLGALLVFWPFSLIVAAGYGAVRKSGDRTS